MTLDFSTGVYDEPRSSESFAIYSAMPDAQKRQLCIDLLEEFGGEVVQETAKGELRHRCTLPLGLHTDRDSVTASINYKKLVFKCYVCDAKGGLLWWIATNRGEGHRGGPALAQERIRDHRRPGAAEAAGDPRRAVPPEARREPRHPDLLAQSPRPVARPPDPASVPDGAGGVFRRGEHRRPGDPGGEPRTVQDRLLLPGRGLALLPADHHPDLLEG
jgi:hypothetical protein